MTGPPGNPSRSIFNSFGWFKGLPPNKQFPGGSVVKSACNAGDRRRGFDPWVRKILWRRARQSTPVFLPGDSGKAEKPCGPQSIVVQRAGCEWSDLAHSTVTPQLGDVSEGLWVNSDLGATSKPCKNFLTSLVSGPESCLLPSLLRVRRDHLACCWLSPEGSGKAAPAVTLKLSRGLVDLNCARSLGWTPAFPHYFNLTGSFTWGNSELTWLLWGTLDMNTIIHLGDALEAKGEK